MNMKKEFSVCLIVLLTFVLFVSSCKKDKTTPAVVHETGTMTDVDGNIYKTVKIGNQWWMAENLKVKKFRNGFQIRNGQDSADWVKNTGAYCVYQNNSSSPGLLYNWFTVTD